MSLSTGIWRWAAEPSSPPYGVIDSQSRLTLGEGGTALLKSRRIGPEIGLDHLYFKLETTNPTGSYKDRFAAAAVSQLLAEGKRCCLATSSGNAGASLATYCAAAGIQCTIAIVETTPTGKLTQMLAHGARLVRVRGFGLDRTITEGVFKHLARISEIRNGSLQISAYRYSPIGMSGVQSISYELSEQLTDSGKTADHVFVPAGGGGLALAVARGFEAVAKSGRSAPRIEVVQPEGNDTIASPMRNGWSQAQAIECRTRISGLQVPSVVDGDSVIARCRDSGGTGHIVSDEAIWQIQQRLAKEEGVFCEPAGAVSVAGTLAAASKGELDPRATIVCLITGSAFKDPPSVKRMVHDVEVPMTNLDEMGALLQ